MLPQNESALFSALMCLAENLNNHHSLSAYPQMQPLFMQAASNLQMIANTGLGNMRQEMFFGKTPWAKLYELQTGKKIAVPGYTKILENIAPERFTKVPQRPFKEILDYWKTNRPNPEGKEEFVYNDYEFEHQQTTIDYKTGEAVFWWDNNDMRLTLPKFWESRGFLTCPLFDEPYEVAVDMTYMQHMLLGPLYEEIVGEENIEPFEEKHLLMNLFYGATVEERVQLEDDHPFKQLAELMVNHRFTKGCLNRATVELNGHVISLVCERNYGYHHTDVYDILRVSGVSRKVETDGVEKLETVHNWSKNPLLVRDILAWMPNFIDMLLTQHDISMKEV